MWLGGRESHESFFVRLSPFAILCQVFQILPVRRSLSFRRPSSFCRRLRLLPSQCHSKCHSLWASPEILLSKPASKSFANPAALLVTYRLQLSPKLCDAIHQPCLAHILAVSDANRRRSRSDTLRCASECSRRPCTAGPLRAPLACRARPRRRRLPS
jgi:hypothetical protein